MGWGCKIVLILLKGKNIAQGTEDQHNGKKHRPRVSAASVMSIQAWKNNLLCSKLFSYYNIFNCFVPPFFFRL